METSSLVRELMRLPLFESTWVLWLLMGMSVASIAIVIERAWFFRRRSVDADALRFNFDKLLDERDVAGAAKLLAGHDSLEANVVLFGLRCYPRGPDAVEDLLAGGESRERTRFGRRLGWLATIGSTAPFVGLFGTVLGIIRAFGDLAGDLQGGASTVMGGISEALIATAVGLFVAIPALVAYNAFAASLKVRVAGMHLLAKTLLSHLKSDLAHPSQWKGV